MRWIVIETACFPASWKVTYRNWNGDDVGNNSTVNYFRDPGQANAEADKRNQLS